jgi:hypothetical protein
MKQSTVSVAVSGMHLKFQDSSKLCRVLWQLDPKPKHYVSMTNLYSSQNTYTYTQCTQVRDLLFGPPNSRVKLQFQRQDGSTYDVTALRHVPKTEAGINAAKFDKVDQRQPQRSFIGAGFSSSPPDPSHNTIYRSSDSMQGPLHRPPSALPGNNNFFMDAMHSVGSILLPPTKSPQMASANDPKYMSPYQMIPSTPPVSAKTEPSGKTAIYLPPSASSYGYGSVGYGTVSASGTVQTAAVSTHGIFFF